MNPIRMAVAQVLCTVLWAAACGKTEPGPRSADAARSDKDGMAGMPGMMVADQSDSSALGDSAKPGAIAASVTFTSAQIQHGGVRWAAVTVGMAAGSASVPGEVTPNDDRTFRLGAAARGRILSVSVRPGDRVTAGQPLVQLQSAEAGMAQSDVSKSDAEVASRRSESQYASTARARAERLLALKAIPRQEYERAITDDEHARAALSQSEAEARRARSTAEQLGAAGGSSGEIILRAPAAGVVLARTAVPGTVVEAGAPLIVITDPASLWLTINAPEQFAALIQRGSRLRFTVPAYPSDSFTARVDAVGAGLEADTRTLSVRATIANGERLKPQMLATVVIEGVGRTPATFVPDDAIQLMLGKPHVFLVRMDSQGGARFVRREVVLGSRADGRVAVLRGLAAGDVIVIAGSFAVKAEFQKATMPKMEM